MKMYHCLLAYKKKYKTTRVQIGWKEDCQLATGVKTQRMRCKEKNPNRSFE
jgi:hypothetical protein